MTPDPHPAAATAAASDLSVEERHLLRRLMQRKRVARDVNADFDARLGLGDRVADRVAQVGGSWSFIIGFLGFLGLWTVANVWLAREAPDPYPFIFLNLLLSMLAALQAPIIMMSQNRQAEKDRLAARHDYEVNLRAEIEIMALHEKLDHLRTEELRALIEKQERQIELLTRLLAGR